MPAISPIYRVDGDGDGAKTYDFKLRKAAPLSGSVKAPDGKPLKGADVYEATNLLIVTRRKVLSQTLRNAQLTKTDAAGRFQLPPEVEPFYLVVLHDQGFAVVNEKQFAETHDITIKAWGEGQEDFRAERSPVTRRERTKGEEAKPGLTVRLIDEDGKPVIGAIVGTRAERFPASNTFTPCRLTLGILRPAFCRSPEGTARIVENDNINCVVARQAARKLAGMAAVSDEQRKQAEPITVVMHPECFVSGTLTAKGLVAHNHKLDFTNV